ncbi:glycine hydroxymethyltransferase [Verrucomicrobiaceae bacterium SCGC AG-212-N21]|nr:glycine hydroxymethyltransferase [Verrucomicrobiaceae bacterium SCGC AG-212-N21]
MAEVLFRALVKGRSDYEVLSAGLSASHGDFATHHTAELMRDMGLDLSGHRSRAVTKELLKEVTHVIAMGNHHLHAIEVMFPEAAEKAYLVSEFSPDDALRGYDVSDPFGGSRADYEETRDILQQLLPTVLAYIDQTFEKPPVTVIETIAMSANAPASAKPVSTTQRLAVGADHGGVDLKNELVTYLRDKGHDVTDLGTHSKDSVDYPDFADAVAERVLAGQADAGLLVCTSGIGVCMAANRHPNIQAALVSEPAEAATTREHNNANVLCLSGSKTSPEAAKQIVDTFLATPFAGGRHARRVGKMNTLHDVMADIVRGVDPAIADIILGEENRQQNNIELIASENFASRAVQAAQGSCLTNKYAEGYPAKRWYGGCEEVDKAEQLAIDRACQLFGSKFANVQPHSGSQANAAVYFSVLQPGDKVLGMNLAHGGHLTHGNPANFSGRFYKFCQYGVSQSDERIDYDELAEVAKREQPKMITAGASAYPRVIDFARMSEIAKSVGAYLFVDMAHIAGLVAGGVHPSPMPYADFVTTTTHKSLRGPRGGMILTNSEELFKKIQSQVFPGIQGGPLMHVIAAKAVCFGEALQPEFKTYQQQIVKNAQALAAELAALGYRIVSGGTDNHLMLVDLRPKGLNGKIASETLDHAGITVNKNGIPFDTEKITLGGGIRVGTPAVTTRGMKEAEMKVVAGFIHQALESREKPEALAKIRGEVMELNKRFPLP